MRRSTGEGDQTGDQTWSHEAPASPALPPLPGLLKVYSGDRAQLEPYPIESRRLVIGRGQECDIAIDDARLSRRHAEVWFAQKRWHVRDLDSRNGTFVDGERNGTVAGEECLVSVGATLILLCSDVRRFIGQTVEVRGDVVIGPTLRAVRGQIARAARSADVLSITGETGSGKELAARLFHDEGPRAKGPFVAVNCAAIPAELAERLLFGALRGAYSGADKEAEGYLAAADRGTLFLDEVAELPLPVQAKLLRVIESREVLPLGASETRAVDVRICSATNVALADHVAAGRFRQDLYFRLAQPMVRLPSLRERREEIPWLAEVALRRLQPRKRAHVSLVEALLLGEWPGNVRELMKSVTAAGQRSSGDEVLAKHLVRAVQPRQRTRPRRGAASVTTVPARSPPSDEELREALAREEGNLSRAARALGMHRTQLRRRLTRMGAGDGDADVDSDVDSEG